MIWQVALGVFIGQWLFLGTTALVVAIRSRRDAARLEQMVSECKMAQNGEEWVKYMSKQQGMN